ncbi:L-lysine permease [Eubacterium sulci ATCC 35585]|jgi:L-lysine permease|nr:L-lysine permease [Eubacterium sulci ATCC 35585]MBF1157943.1 LysE family transporter [[Eubacterium] sulci]EUC78271.1 translocator protein, LysE family [Eubacterium sulci ATCC 35585]MBF1162176.1 LysE family transporter [[Eubacterium] sulci]MBF1169446.1 LysE family transporter [[Eubacterium] sulci]
MNILFQGLMLGFAYVMPIGAQNIFAINTALTQKRSRILATAFIIAFFDITLSIACFFGIGALIKLSVWIELAILGIGALVVFWIGLSIFRSKDTMSETKDVSLPLTRVIWTACVVTWFNPQALIDGSLLLGAFHASLPSGKAFLFILGVSIASLTWWFGMTTIVSLIRTKINDKMLRVINIVCGLIIMFYGLKLLNSFRILVFKTF